MVTSWQSPCLLYDTYPPKNYWQVENVSVQDEQKITYLDTKIMILFLTVSYLDSRNLWSCKIWPNSSSTVSLASGLPSSEDGIMWPRIANWSTQSSNTAEIWSASKLDNIMKTIFTKDGESKLWQNKKTIYYYVHIILKIFLKRCFLVIVFVVVIKQRDALIWTRHLLKWLRFDSEHKATCGLKIVGALTGFSLSRYY